MKTQLYRNQITGCIMVLNREFLVDNETWWAFDMVEKQRKHWWQFRRRYRWTGVTFETKDCRDFMPI
jgi:hypothetical protein